MSETAPAPQNQLPLPGQQLPEEANPFTYQPTPGQELGFDSLSPLLDIPETNTPTPTSETQPKHPERALARLGARLSNFANRRTTSEYLRETKDTAISYSTEKVETTKAQAKKVATKVGIAAILSVDSALETAGKVTDKVNHHRGTIAAVREFNKSERTNRKNARLDARAEKREHRKNDKIEAQAWKANAKFNRQAKRAETRAELTEKAKKSARFAGKAALFTGVAVAAIPAAAAFGTYKGAKHGAELGMKLDQKTAELAVRGTRRIIEVADDLGEATTIKVVRGAKRASEIKTATVENTKKAGRFARDTTMLNVRAGHYIAKEGAKSTKVNYHTRRRDSLRDKAIAQDEKIARLNK